MCFLYRSIADIILLLPEKVKQIRSHGVCLSQILNPFEIYKFCILQKNTPWQKGCQGVHNYDAFNQ